jgi:hypothetical protein
VSVLVVVLVFSAMVLAVFAGLRLIGLEDE